jgi:hypothetical protein
MVNYENAFKRPFTDIKKLLIGIVLNLIPIVNFMALGYQLKCAKTAMQKKFELPEWDDWVNLFVKGLIALVISIIYMIPAIIVMFFVAASVISAIMVSATAGEGTIIDSLMLALSSFSITVVFLLVLILLTLYFLPSAIMSYVRDDSFGSAFKFGEIFRNAFTVGYLTVWVIVAIYSFILTMILSIIPVIGSTVGGFISGVTAMTLFGEIYSEPIKK